MGRRVVADRFVDKYGGHLEETAYGRGDFARFGSILKGGSTI
jgi:hypothetical protein